MIPVSLVTVLVVLLAFGIHYELLLLLSLALEKASFSFLEMRKFWYFR